MVRTPSWPIEIKLPSGSCRRKGAGTASLPFSSTRTRCVPQNIHGLRGRAAERPVDRGGGEQWLQRRPLGPLQRGGVRRRLRRFLIHHYSPLITAIRHLAYPRRQKLSTSNHNMWWVGNQCNPPLTEHVVEHGH